MKKLNSYFFIMIMIVVCLVGQKDLISKSFTENDIALEFTSFSTEEHKLVTVENFILSLDPVWPPKTMYTANAYDPVWSTTNTITTYDPVWPTTNTITAYDPVWPPIAMYTKIAYDPVWPPIAMYTKIAYDPVWPTYLENTNYLPICLS